MNKRQVISSLSNIAEELDNNGLYIEAEQVTNVMRKIAQVQNEAPPQNEDDLYRKTVDLHHEFYDKVPKETVYTFLSQHRSTDPGFLFISDPKTPNVPPKKMSLDQVRQFINNGFK
jgi:hypothetical protein